MAVVLEELVEKLSLDVDKSSFTKSLLLVEGIKAGFHLLEKAIHFAAHELKAIVVETLDYASAARKGAARTGLTTDAFQELRFASGAAGVGVETLERGLIFLARNMQAAEDGSKTTRQAFRRLGVAFDDGKGRIRDTDAVLGDLAERFASMPNSAEKVALATRIFGKGGAQLIPFLNKGREGLAELRVEARELGLVLGADALQKTKEVSLGMHRLHAILEGVKLQIGVAVLPIVLDLIKSFGAWVQQNKELIAQGLIKVFAGIKLAARGLWFVIRRLGDVLSWVSDHWDTIVEVMGHVYRVARQLLIPALIAIGALLAGPLIMAVGGFLAAAAPFIGIALAVAALAVSLADANSEIGQLWITAKAFIMDWAQWTSDDPAWLRAIKTVVETIVNIPSSFVDAFNDIVQDLKQVVAEIEQQLNPFSQKNANIASGTALEQRGLGSALGSVALRANRGLLTPGGHVLPGAQGARIGIGQQSNSVIVNVNAVPGEAAVETAQRAREAIEEMQQRWLREAVAGVSQ